MKERISIIMLFAMALILTLCLVACNFNDEEFHDFSHSTSLELTSPKLYIAKFMSDYSTWTGAIGQGEVLDFWIEVEYPDMSQLY